ncbi:hypothetical protein HC928_11740 [bacterium]|nr:hypothetical protein [bacterium]
MNESTAPLRLDLSTISRNVIIRELANLPPQKLADILVNVLKYLDVNDLEDLLDATQDALDEAKTLRDGVITPFVFKLKKSQDKFYVYCFYGQDCVGLGRLYFEQGKTYAVQFLNGSQWETHVVQFSNFYFPKCSWQQMKIEKKGTLVLKIDGQTRSYEFPKCNQEFKTWKIEEVRKSINLSDTKSPGIKAEVKVTFKYPEQPPKVYGSVAIAGGKSTITRSLEEWRFISQDLPSGNLIIVKMRLKDHKIQTTLADDKLVEILGVTSTRIVLLIPPDGSSKQTSDNLW